MGAKRKRARNKTGEGAKRAASLDSTKVAKKPKRAGSRTESKADLIAIAVKKPNRADPRTESKANLMAKVDG